MRDEIEERETARIRELEHHAEEVNSRIVPETLGYVRTTGPRRQFRAEVVDGRLVYTEI